VPKTVVNDHVFKEELQQESPEAKPHLVRTLVQEKNTTERAIVRMRVPRKKVEVNGEEHLQEIEMDDRVYVFPAQVFGKDYTLYTFNQYVPRAFRRDIFNVVKKIYGEQYFEGRDANKDLETFTRRTEELQELFEKRFIDEIYDEEKMPIFDFEININDSD